MDNFRVLDQFQKFFFDTAFVHNQKYMIYREIKIPHFVTILEVFVGQRKEKHECACVISVLIYLYVQAIPVAHAHSIFPFFVEQILLRSLQKVDFYFTINRIFFIMHECSIKGRSLEMLKNGQSYPYFLFNLLRRSMIVLL